MLLNQSTIVIANARLDNPEILTTDGEKFKGGATQGYFLHTISYNAYTNIPSGHSNNNPADTVGIVLGKDTTPPRKNRLSNVRTYY